MGLKSPAEYVQGLRDHRVTFRGSERFNDVTALPRLKIPLPTLRPTTPAAIGVQRHAHLRDGPAARGAAGARKVKLEFQCSAKC
jgi:hypothetical protein